MVGLVWVVLAGAGTMVFLAFETVRFVEDRLYGGSRLGYPQVMQDAQGSLYVQDDKWDKWRPTQPPQVGYDEQGRQVVYDERGHKYTETDSWRKRKEGA